MYWGRRRHWAFAGDRKRLCLATSGCSEGQSSRYAGSITERWKAEYAVIFGEGDEAFSGLLAFAQTYHVTSAHFTAIGGLSRATLAWFDPQRKMFKKIPIDNQVEVVSMIGDIALYQGKPVVHMHMVVATSDGSTRGGHVLAAFVSPTLEVMVTVDPIAMQKRLDPENGLTLIDPALR